MAKGLVKTEDNTALIKTAIDGKVSSKELGAMLSKLNSSEENEITAEYMKIEPGESVRAWFMEMTSIKSIADGAQEGDMSPAARFAMEDGSFTINADAVIVSTVSKLKKPTPLEILCTGTAGTPTRKYKTFKIIELN